ncbi:MAG: hypothetical protein ABJB10_15955 [Mesorhizobium sp.]
MASKSRLALGLLAGLAATPGLASDLVGPQAQAETEASAAIYPNIKIEGSAELQFDRMLPTNDPSARVSSAFITIEPEITANLSEQFRLFAHLLYEPVADPDSGEMQWLRNEGFFAEELYAQTTLGDFDVSLGKVDPMFGVASDEAPGIYGKDFAASYDYRGALGGGVNWHLASRQTTGFDGGAATLNQSLGIYAFSADTSFLSRSLFVDRGQLDLSDGGLGNTDSPSSFSIAYSVKTVDAKDELSGPAAQLAVRHLAAGTDGGNDEWGLLASGQDIFGLGDDVTLKTLAELAYFVHEGGGDANALTATAGAEIQQGPWIASLTAAVHKPFGGDGGADSLITTSFGREFEFESAGTFRVDVAYAHSKTDGEIANTFGFRLHKDFAWSSSAE